MTKLHPKPIHVSYCCFGEQWVACQYGKTII